MITMAIAIIILILILTIIGVMLSQHNNTIFPPTKNPCPDYWTELIDTNGTISCQIDSRNIGSFNSNKNPHAPGYNSSNNSINFNDPGWSKYSNATTIMCGLKKWCNQNKIMWDGVSNFNGCS